MKNKSGLRTFNEATAIVTGAASGIGAALARELGLRGCEVVLADLQVTEAKKIAKDITDAGGAAVAAKLDVSDFSTVEKLVRSTVKRTGRLDYMFNNAGIGIGGPIEKYGIKDWEYIMNINLRGVVNGVQAAYKLMTEQGFGHIVNTASMAGLTTGPLVSYSMTKFAVVGLSKCLRIEAELYGVRVSVLCPGAIRTPMLSGGKYGRSVITSTPEIEEEIRRMFEKMRPMDPEIFARKSLDQVAKNRAIIIFPAWWKILWWLDRLFPNAMINVGIKGARKSFKKFM